MAVSLGLCALQSCATRGNDRNNIQESRMSYPTRVGGARVLQEQRNGDITERTNTFKTTIGRRLSMRQPRFDPRLDLVFMVDELALDGFYPSTLGFSAKSLSPNFSTFANHPAIRLYIVLTLTESLCKQLKCLNL
jgi:hypothetical protein